MTTAWILPGGSSYGAVQVGQLEALIGAGHHFRQPHLEQALRHLFGRR